ncbi:sugar phosphate isomerase/epimerase [Patescibacteria group bacterium]|jgi:endonuclease IV|nr:sugar phosphate isomerase/epimerase [Patescibacteria group bacterium]
MIRYGLKLWTGNRHLFEEAAQRYKEGAFDFIEMYFHPEKPMDADGLKLLSGIPFGVHAPHELDEFIFGEAELTLWRRAQKSADELKASTIVVHPGYERSIPDFATFERELSKIDEPRLLIENMPGLDTLGDRLFAHDLETLKRIRALKPICFDIEKAAKAAAFHKMDHREYIRTGLATLQPAYFHISGGTVSEMRAQHENLWDSDYDFAFVKAQLEALPYDARLVFETPKKGNDLQNDLENMAYFRKAGA